MKTNLRSLSTIFLFLTAAFSIASAQPIWQEAGSCTFRGIQKLPSGRIVMVTSGGDLYSSTDDGSTWSMDTINPSMVITSVNFFDDLHGIAGAGSITSSAIEVTSDGGTSWSTDTSSVIRGILSVSAPSLDTFYASSYPHSGILRSTDQGHTWDSLSLPTTVQIWYVKFLTSLEGYAYGDSGFLAHTTDAGKTWTKLPTGLANRILSLDIDGSRLAIGSQLVGSGDGAVVGLSSDLGQTWKYASFSDNFYASLASPVNANEDSLFGPMSVVRFVNSDTIIAFESGNLWKFWSTDFGNTWTWSRVSPDYVHESYSSSTTLEDGYVDAQGNGFVCGQYGTLYRITDFGLDGHLQAHFDAASPYLESMTGNTHWIHAVGYGGGFTVSSDAGLTWYTRPGPSGQLASYTGLHFTTIDSGVIFSGLGLDADYWPFQATTDNGSDWNSLDVGQFSTLRRTLYGQDGFLYTVGDSTVIRSTDEGYTWQTYTRYWFTTSPLGAGRKVLWTIIQNGAFLSGGRASLLLYEMDSVYQPDSSEQYGYEPVFSVITTSDGGQTWSSAQVLTQNVYLWGMAFVNQNLGYIGGGNDGGNSATLFRTTNGGTTWSQVHGIVNSLFDTCRINDIAFNSKGTIGIIAGDYGLLLESYDSGQTWNAIDSRCPTGTPSEFYRPCFLNDTEAIVQSLNEGFWKKTFSLAAQQADVSPNQSMPEYLSLYPNPTSYTLTIESPAGAISILDPLGRSYDVKQMGNTLDISSLPSGVYFVSDGHARAKFVKE